MLADKTGMDLTYRSVMNLAAERKLVLSPEQRLRWQFVQDSQIYSAVGGGHYVDPCYGNLLVMCGGAVVIEGAPTVSAAQSAADCALAMGLVASEVAR